MREDKNVNSGETNQPVWCTMSASSAAASPLTAARTKSIYSPVLRRQKYLKRKGLLLGETSPPKTRITKKEYDRQRYLAKKQGSKGTGGQLPAACSSPILFAAPSIPANMPTALAVPVVMAELLDVTWPGWSPPCNGEPAQARVLEPDLEPETDEQPQPTANAMVVHEQAASDSDMADEPAATASPAQPKSKHEHALARVKRMAARQHRQALVLMPAFLRREREEDAMLMAKEWEWMQTPFYQFQRERERSQQKAWLSLVAPQPTRGRAVITLHTIQKYGRGGFRLPLFIWEHADQQGSEPCSSGNSYMRPHEYSQSMPLPSSSSMLLDGAWTPQLTRAGAKAMQLERQALAAAAAAEKMKFFAARLPPNPKRWRPPRQF